jgi:hypothetical protein
MCPRLVSANIKKREQRAVVLIIAVTDHGHGHEEREELCERSM